ncbi:MAG: sigma-54 dependent transcriptional regulator [Pirellulaceae bacterium]
MQANDLRGCSNEHKSIVEKLRKVAATDAEVLIVGPSGVGKELYARFVHDHSRRSESAFVPVNCGGLSGELLENQMFGHVGGAFTGARPQSEGLVNEAEGGTLFLDEVDSLSVSSQIKLLRFLQDKQYRRMGENRLRHANVRIISATNADLENAVSEDRFREDLFFRLRVVPIKVPALHDRPDDILELVDVFINKASQEYNLPCVEFSDDALVRMKSYEWPGNIRELENCVDYLTCLQLQRPVEPDDLPLLKKKPCKTSDNGAADLESLVSFYLRLNEHNGEEFQDLKKRFIDAFEKQYLHRALQTTNGNVSAAARMCGKHRRALSELMHKHHLSPDGYRIHERFDKVNPESKPRAN